MRTPEQTDKALDQLFRDLNIIEIKDPPIVTDLPSPTPEGMVLNTFDKDTLVFTPVIFKDNLFTTFVNRGGLLYMVTSPNGLNSWSYTPTTNAPYGSIVYADNKWKGTAHKWYGSTCNSYYYGSTDGISWATTWLDRSQTCGEDRNMLYDNGIWRCYIRVQPRPRTIGYSESVDGTTNWSKIVEILKPDAMDGELTQFYHMSVIKVNVGYFGLLTTYRIGNFLQDTEQNPPYTDNEHTTDLQVVFSLDGKTNWQRCNNRKNFIERGPGVKQIYGWWSVIGDQVFIYTSESKRRHTIYDNSYNVAGNNFYSSRYKISVADLIKYKPL